MSGRELESSIRTASPAPRFIHKSQFTVVSALALLFLALHLAYLPPSLEDLDSVNFALGVQQFDVARHQPHPPGYPVFIAMAKASTRLLGAAGVAAPEARGLAVWSAIGGALAIWLAWMFFAAVIGDGLVALLASVLMACAPLFWFTAVRPLSDTIGLAAAFAALAPMAIAMRRARTANPDVGPAGVSALALLVAAAFLAGFVIGVRSQTFVMTLPLLTYALFAPRLAWPRRAPLAALVAASAGVAVWAVPLVIASGGPGAYVKALRSQGAEDFSGVVMVWTHHTPRIAAYALLNSFALPWDSLVLGAIVLVAAASGAAILSWRAPRAAVILALVFVPYAAFHLLFHEIVTVRYALPIVPLIALLAVIALAAMHRYVAILATGALAAYGLSLAVPASIAFAREPSPVFRMVSGMKARAQNGPPPVVAMHRREFTETRRWRQWSGGLPGALLPAPRDYEWLELTRAWREGIASPVWFVADPRRTDLALIDGRGRRTIEYRWPFHGAVYVGGARPDEMDWHVYDSPGWFLEQGWALTPEVAGITERDGWGPHRRPSVGWIRRDLRSPVMLFGGRHLGAPGESGAHVIVDVDERPALVEDVKPGFFLAAAQLGPDALKGPGTFAKLTVRAQALAAGGGVPRVALEQFDMQPRGVPMLGFDEGWQEPEYNSTTGRSWRWMSERAVLRVVNASGDVTLRITGENPRRYYKTAPTLRVSAAGRELNRFAPAADFSYTVAVPASALATSDGRVTLESNEMFIPGDREGTADRRHLAIRIYSVTVDR